MWIGYELIIFVIALALLLLGANRLVDAAAYIASKLGIHPIIVGITLLSIGTSIPEIFTSITAFMMGHGDIALGNIIGSELVQITLILGIVALIRPLKGNRKEILFYGLSMVIAILLVLFVAMDGFIIWFEGLFLVIVYVLFLGYIAKSQKVTTHKFEHKEEKKWYLVTLDIIISIALIILGSKFMIGSTINIASFFGVSEFLISLFLVGLGTSLPELVVSGVAAWKGRFGLSVGNLLGSNITDPTLSLGLGALFVKSSAVSALAYTSAMYLIFVCVVAIGLFAWKKKLTRPMAIVLIALYLVSFFIF